MRKNILFVLFVLMFLAIAFTCRSQTAKKPHRPNDTIKLLQPKSAKQVIKKGTKLQYDTVKNVLVYYKGIVDVTRGEETIGRWAEAVWIRPNYPKKIKKELIAIYYMNGADTIYLDIKKPYKMKTVNDLN